MEAVGPKASPSLIEVLSLGTIGREASLLTNLLDFVFLASSGGIVFFPLESSAILPLLLGKVLRTLFPKSFLLNHHALKWRVGNLRLFYQLVKLLQPNLLRHN